MVLAQGGSAPVGGSGALAGAGSGTSGGVGGFFSAMTSRNLSTFSLLKSTVLPRASSSRVSNVTGRSPASPAVAASSGAGISEMYSTSDSSTGPFGAEAEP